MTMRERRLSRLAKTGPRPASRKRQLFGFLILSTVAVDANAAGELVGRKKSLRENKDGIASLQQDYYPGVLSDMDGVINEKHLFDPFHLHPATLDEQSDGANADDFDWVGQKRIFGGEIAPNKYYYFVKFRFGNKKCAGSVVHPEFVLTAAHCVKSDKEPANEEIFIGAYEYDHKTLRSTNYAEVRHLSEIFVHPSYGEKTGNDFDFALLRLEQSTSVTPVVFDDGTYDSKFVDSFSATTSRTSLTAIGLGAMDLNPTVFPDRLQKVSLPYMSNARCSLPSRWGSSRITNQMICAGGEEGVDSCIGDSGGPLLYVLNPGTFEEKHIQVGVNSWGASNCGTKNYPGVYARVSKAKTWIDDTIRKNLNLSPSQPPSAIPTQAPSATPSLSNPQSGATPQSCDDDPNWTYRNQNKNAKNCEWVYACDKPKRRSRRCRRKGVSNGITVVASAACPGACVTSCWKDCK